MHHPCCHWHRVFLVDLAENSVEVCRNRYRDRQSCYRADFFPLNCTTVWSAFLVSSCAICLSVRNSCETKSNVQSPVSIWSAVNLFYTIPTTRSNRPTDFCAMQRNFFVTVVISLPLPSTPVDYCTYSRRCSREKAIRSFLLSLW